MIKCNIITYRRGPGDRGSPWSPCTPQRLVLTAILHPKRAEIREKCWILLFCRLCRHFLAVLLWEKKVRKRFKNGEDGGKIFSTKSEKSLKWRPGERLRWPLTFWLGLLFTLLGRRCCTKLLIDLLSCSSQHPEVRYSLTIRIRFKDAYTSPIMWSVIYLLPVWIAELRLGHPKQAPAWVK